MKVLRIVREIKSTAIHHNPQKSRNKASENQFSKKMFHFTDE